MNVPKTANLRARDLGWITTSLLEPGLGNAITDVTGVLVGHRTLIHGQAGPLKVGTGPVRTGITAIRPHPGNIYRENRIAAVHILNGYGKTVGLAQIQETGRLETPILLTNTLSVWRAADALVDWVLKENPQIGISPLQTLNPVVGECNDGYLNDIQGRHITPEDVWQALDSASAKTVMEGNIGGGTGTRAYGYKAGIGTASRVCVSAVGKFTVGVLVQANFGQPRQLVIRGLPVGMQLANLSGNSGEMRPEQAESGSCLMVVATDAPLSSQSLKRIARRAPLGLARTGTVSSPGSGDFVLAFSTAGLGSEEANSGFRVADHGSLLSNLFQGVVEATEEAVLNSLAAAQTMVGRDYHRAEAIPIDEIQALLPD